MMRDPILTRSATKRMSSLAPILLPCDRTRAKTRRSSAKRKGSSAKSAVDLLPDAVLVEILARLPCHKFAHRCKLVSKRWRNLMSDPYFLGRFVCVQGELHQQKQMTTLINNRGEEFLNRMSNPLKLFFQKLMAANHLEQEPLVAGTYNDLLLCHVGDYGERKYYICNPFIEQWTALPPPPICPKGTEALQEGFMCDLPYYKSSKEDYYCGKQGHVVQLNARYRCRVVRLISPSRPSNRFTVHIFSSETGEWRESTVSAPQDISLHQTADCYANPYNRKLCWDNWDCGRLVIVNPFMFSTGNDDAGDGVDHTYQCRLITFERSFHEGFFPRCLGVYGGRLKMVQEDLSTDSIFLLDLNDQEIDGSFKEFALAHRRRYLFENEMIPNEDSIVESIALDPDNEEVLYVSIDEQIVVLNLRTRMWQLSNMAERITFDCISWHHFTLTLPWWPTPVPMQPRYAHESRPSPHQPAPRKRTAASKGRLRASKRARTD